MWIYNFGPNKVKTSHFIKKFFWLQTFEAVFIFKLLETFINNYFKAKNCLIEFRENFPNWQMFRLSFTT